MKKSIIICDACKENLEHYLDSFVTRKSVDIEKTCENEYLKQINIRFTCLEMVASKILQTSWNSLLMYEWENYALNSKFHNQPERLSEKTFKDKE